MNRTKYWIQQIDNLLEIISVIFSARPSLICPYMWLNGTAEVLNTKHKIKCFTGSRPSLTVPCPLGCANSFSGWLQWLIRSVQIHWNFLTVIAMCASFKGYLPRIHHLWCSEILLPIFLPWITIYTFWLYSELNISSSFLSHFLEFLKLLLKLGLVLWGFCQISC